MKKVKNERPTWALFRHVPNDKEGQEFLKMFKLYKNPEVVNHFIRYRKPKPGTSYSYGGHCKSSDGTEFSIYVRQNCNYKASYQDELRTRIRLDKECNSLQHEVAELSDIRLQWRHSYYELHEMSIIQFICYKFKQWRK